MHWIACVVLGTLFAVQYLTRPIVELVAEHGQVRVYNRGRTSVRLEATSDCVLDSDTVLRPGESKAVQFEATLPPRVYMQYYSWIGQSICDSVRTYTPTSGSADCKPCE